MKNKKLLIMFATSFVAMFISTYAMIDRFDHLYLNINKVYMAALMTGLMGIINVTLMSHMYKEAKLKLSVFVVSLVTVLLSFFLIRTQGFVDNESFLRAMIPHHSSAILMCDQANITDTQIADLCDAIVDTQLREIELMKDFLDN